MTTATATAVLLAGLLVFLGLHSIRVFADGWRSAKIATLGENRWKGLYTLGSFVGLALIIWGFSLSRQAPVILYSPPLWTRSGHPLRSTNWSNAMLATSRST